MDQSANINRVAEQIVTQHGGGAFNYLCDAAQMAKLSGDIESAITWWDVALAALEILNERDHRSVPR